jgi:hypothetical protein
MDDWPDLPVRFSAAPYQILSYSITLASAQGSCHIPILLLAAIDFFTFLHSRELWLASSSTIEKALCEPSPSCLIPHTRAVHRYIPVTLSLLFLSHLVPDICALRRKSRPLLSRALTGFGVSITDLILSSIPLVTVVGSG